MLDRGSSCRSRSGRPRRSRLIAASLFASTIDSSRLKTTGGGSRSADDMAKSRRLQGFAFLRQSGGLLLLDEQPFEQRDAAGKMFGTEKLVGAALMCGLGEPRCHTRIREEGDHSASVGAEIQWIDQHSA